MTNKKSGFLTFIFSLIPGAGEMYMGFFKQGLSLMLLVFLDCAVGSFFNIEFMIMILPIIWLYSFFHVHHLRSLPLEEFYMVEDKFLFLDNIGEYKQNWNVSTKKVVAVILVIMGVMMLWNTFISTLSWFLPDFFREILWKMEYFLPRVVMGAAILYVGFKMLKGNPIKKDIIEHKEEE